MKKYLPIGSVVLLNEAEKRLMICGRVQTDIATEKQYDYSACLYPEGLIDSKELYMFNNEDINTVFFMGFQDQEEFAFRKYIEETMDSSSKDSE